MSEVALWQLIRDWLPEAGWQILTVQPPRESENDHATIIHKSGGIAAIYDDKVIMWTHFSPKPIKAVDPMFFCKLDLALTSVFSEHEWYKKKTSDIFASQTRKKIWPKK